MRTAPVRSHTAQRPLEFGRLRGAPVLAEVLHLLCVQEFVFVLAGRVLHEDGHGVGVFVEQVPAYVLRRVLLFPSAQPHDVGHGVFALIQECMVESASPALRLLEQVSAIGQTGAQRVCEKDAERAIFGEHVDEAGA